MYLNRGDLVYTACNAIPAAAQAFSMTLSLTPSPAAPQRASQAAVFRQRTRCCRSCGAGACAAGGRLVKGLCRRCYALHHHDQLYFGGLRQQVLARDNHRCQACGKLGRRRRSLAVHHRKPGISSRRWLVTLCLACHARVHRTLVWRFHSTKSLPAAALWRELHPGAPEQLALDFGEGAMAEQLALV